MKYLIARDYYQGKFTGIPRAFIFPATIEHKQFHELVLEPLGLKAIRGGFIYSVGEGKIKCQGESFSLGISSDPEEDIKIINKELEG